jgi:hypothetical protein
MKLRVAFCAAVALSAVAAYAQPHPWLHGPYDKLTPRDMERPVLIMEPPRMNPIRKVVLVPTETTSPAKSLLSTNRLEAFTYRANYFRLATPKSAVK